MNLKTLSRKEPEEILEAIKSEKLNDESKKTLLGFELEKEEPNEDILEALGYEKPTDPEPEKDEDGNDVELMDEKKEFGMVIHTDGLKHFFQDGKVFDRATKRLLVDTNKK